MSWINQHRFNLRIFKVKDLPMHQTFLYILLVLSFFPNKGFSQNTTVSGHLTGIQDGKYIYLTAYPLDQSVHFQDSAKITKGAFSFHMSIPDGEGSLYYISSVSMQLQGEGQPIDPIQYSHRWQLIYLQKGNAVINGDANNLNKAVYSGDRYMQEENDYFTRQHSNKEWENFINSMNEAYARGENIHASRPLKEDSADKAMLVGLYKRNQIAESWVQAHTNSPYSAVVIYKDISSFFADDTEKKTKCFHLLTPAAKTNKIGKFLTNWLH